MDDKQIVDLYWARSEKAIEETEHKFGSYCRTVSYNILANTADAEECVNDTWLGVELHANASPVPARTLSRQVGPLVVTK